MILPVFRHLLNRLKENLYAQRVSLQEQTSIIIADPGMMFSLLWHVKERYPQRDFNLITPSISLIGQEGLSSLIDRFDNILDEDAYPLWIFSTLLRSASIVLNKKVDIIEDEHAIIASQIPMLGYLLMYQRFPQIKRLFPLLLRILKEDSIFIQEKLFKTNHIAEVQKITNLPSLFITTCSMLGLIYTNKGKRVEAFDHPIIFSDNYRSFQLLKIMEIAELSAQNILFPQVIEAQERCKENMKKYFAIPENEYEEYLSEVITLFEGECDAYGQRILCKDMLEYAQRYSQGGFSFITISEPFKSDLNKFYEANRQGRHLLIWGEADVGKRLLLASVHQRDDNPNKHSPFISIYCSGISNDNFDVEFFGSKGGFFGFERLKGALDIAKDGGTVLLKNIDRMSIDLQEKLSRIIKEGFFYKLGELKPTRFNCRFFLTSRTDPSDTTHISEILLKTINPYILYVPPLRYRRQDIEVIADGIIKKYELPIYDRGMLIGLKEYYENEDFRNNLLDLKRLLFFVSARKILLKDLD
ncbi:MAG: sigma 54-interacting transcriptional regulator [Thermodesulfovibrionales bacterium]